MTGAADRPDGKPVKSTEVVNQVEGYLLWQARVAEAERRARAFTEPMQWLTTAQREEIEEHYVRDCLVRARADLQRIADRCRALRGEYEERYRQLRARCLAFVLTALAVLAAVGVLVLAVARP
ncbi:cytochrome C oxidase subunit I [Streptomyces triticisoli]|jgi:FixJ family two-component response regulator|uniref:cytochrome C oxidase subunit I n=1 Tax=Streptomyces triticisoli TaxID=2182797 RepID=UPI000DD6D439|nr:cytochrome C oxidase subunit I [Streptomyces triticisoli]